MLSSRITKRHQSIIPAEVREELDLHRGGLAKFEIHGKEVVIRKIPLSDVEWPRTLQKTISEWGSEEDDKPYANL
jgi:AbrB family looped-hinge helix DNA binding protein